MSFVLFQTMGRLISKVLQNYEKSLHLLHFGREKHIFRSENLQDPKKYSNFAAAKENFVFLGEMAEWSIASVLKTDVPRGTRGSNPFLSAKTLIFSDL